MKFKQEKITLFLDPHRSYTQEDLTDKKINIILSPSLYWVKKLDLPVNSLREIKKLLPSVFEDMLPEGHYSYHAYKVDDGFIAFAYEDKKILELLQNKGIEIHKVAGFYFAQGELCHDQQPLQVNDTQVLTRKDSIVILTPLSWHKEVEALSLHNHTPHSKPITMQQYGHIIDTKSLFIVMGLLVVFIGVLGAEIWVTNAKVSKLEDAKSQLFHRYNLKATTMQNKAILSKYTAIHTKQLTLREILASLLKLRLPQHATLSEVAFNDKVLRVSFENLDKKQEKRVFAQLKQKYKKLHIQHLGNATVVEIVL